jgi:hypothetical protein
MLNMNFLVLMEIQQGFIRMLALSKYMLAYTLTMPTFKILSMRIIFLQI